MYLHVIIQFVLIVWVFDISQFQVFEADGTFVDELVMAPRTLGFGSAFDVDFSPDADQQYLYNIDGMNAKSVRKKMKSRNFAAAVKREDITQGAEMLGMDLNEHITNVITAMQEVAAELGLVD